MRVTKLKQDLQGYISLGSPVRLLVDLLNEAVLGKKGRKKFLDEDLQKEVLEDLGPFVETTTEAPDQRKIHAALKRLVEKINDLDFRHRWVLRPVKEGTRMPHEFWGVTVELHGYRWMIDKGVEAYPVEPRKVLYCMIGAALDGGMLDKLRRCGECQRFFVQKDPREKFCSDQCRIDFDNKRRLESGYFTDRRRKKRKQALAKASRLLREGKLLGDVTKETGLSLRVLKRAGLGRRDDDRSAGRSLGNAMR